MDPRCTIVIQTHREVVQVRITREAYLSLKHIVARLDRWMRFQVILILFLTFTKIFISLKNWFVLRKKKKRLNCSKSVHSHHSWTWVNRFSLLFSPHPSTELQELYVEYERKQGTSSRGHSWLSVKVSISFLDGIRKRKLLHPCVLDHFHVCPYCRCLFPT